MPCRASGLNIGTVATATVNLLRLAPEVRADDAARTAETLRQAPELLFL